MNDLIHRQPALPPLDPLGGVCVPEAHGRCLTCSDDAQPATILRLLPDGWTALADVGGRAQEIDIMLLEGVSVGAVVLVHGGVALAVAPPEEPTQ